MTKEVDKYIHEVAIPMQHIFKDMLKYAPSKIFGLFGNLAIVPIYTNLLSPSQYGIYTISLAVLSFLCILFSDWIGLAALRFFRKNELCNDITKYLSNIAYILILNLVVMYIVCFFCKSYIYNYFHITPKVFLVILAVIIPISIRAFLFQLLRAQIKPGAFTFSTILNQILTIVIAVLLIKLTHLGAFSILLSMIISISFVDLILMKQTNIFKFLKLEKINFDLLKSVFMYGIPLAVAALSLWIINQSNKVITTHFYGLEKAGYVGVAYSLTFPILMTLFAIITIAAYPRIINLFEDKKDVRPVISKLTGYYMLISIPVVSLMCVYPKEIMDILANSQYNNAYILLPYFALSAFFLSFTDFTTFQYHLANKTYILTLLKIVSGVTGLVLNIFLIKQMGLLGAGVGLLLSNILYFLLTLIIVIPGLEWKIPYRRIIHLAVCYIPTIILWTIISQSQMLPILQMNILLIFYYLFYYLTKKLFKDAII